MPGFQVVKARDLLSVKSPFPSVYIDEEIKNGLGALEFHVNQGSNYTINDLIGP